MEHEGYFLATGGDDHLELPPGFRFHPTDEELITHYLVEKVADREFSARAIGEVDFNKCEPWELPWRAKMGEKEWFFFGVKDRKYPTGLRTNRATDAGYWKATGKDKEIRGGRSLVGMKKTLVFYRGRAPKGEKTNWIMHEYRLDGKSSYSLPNKSSEIEWVLCKVFQKNSSTGGYGDGAEKRATGQVQIGSSSCYAGDPTSMPSLVGSQSGRSTSRKMCSVFSSNQKGHEEKLVEEFAGSALVSSSAATTNSYSDISRIPPLDGGLSRFLKSGEGWVQLLQREGCEVEREGGGSQSQETGLTSEMNPEISSVLSSYEVRRLCFEGHAVPPALSGGLPLDDYMWN
ncbi:unnamed protein product [Spirodela intermedia]|uniref:NAC domain-containing protein n=1 Tax=Spirodela intermedia TaxID=51605 RepID=A0A7I8KVX7_SPIIN|nr:unnamed protein product [Spirodela intermedia]